ncbi:MAG: hypothetical protein ACFFBJ_09145, partial [Promethearchaeota archaeon]
MKNRWTIVVVIFGILLACSLNLSTVNQQNPLVSYDSSSENLTLNTSEHIASSYNDSGVLNPLLVEQSGAEAERIGPMSVRTDREHNPQCNLDLDSSNGWKGKQIEVNVRNLTKLYALNGTFDMGTPGVNLNPRRSVPFHPLGWDADSYDISFYQHQRASYIDTSKDFLTLENEGREYTYMGNLDYYRHYSGTYVYWLQQINSIPASEDFLFGFNLLYDRGPLGTRYEGDFSLRVVLTNGFTTWSIWEIDPTTLSERDVWYSFEQIPVSLTSLPSSLELQIRLDISNTMSIDWDDSNCHGDPSNAKFLTLSFDNVSLVAANPPEFTQVGLNVLIPPIGTTSINGVSGTGQALVNHSSWESDTVPVIFSSNTPVSFEFDVRFSRVVRFQNSCYSTEPTEYGVSYSVSFDEDTSLSLFTYVDYHDNYQNYAIEIIHPKDWSNTTIYDSFANDVTGLCIIIEDRLRIDGDILDHLGWWRINLESPNYARTVQSQLFNETSYQWTDETIFRSGNTAHVSTSIGTPVSVPTIITGFDVTWYLPNGSIWFSEILSGGSLGVINSSSLVLGPINASVGNWFVSIAWNNCSEVAYGQTTFEVHHSTSLSAIFPRIEAPVNMSATGAVSFIDLDNGDILLDTLTTIVGNWSGSDVHFYPNLAKDWWEADFNTSITGSGVFHVLVNASNPFYDTDSCWLEVHVVSETAIESLDGGFVSVGLGSTCTASFSYMYLDGVGIGGATLEVQSWNGPSGGILSWGTSTPIPGEPGNYSIDFIASLSGTYDVIVTGSKANHKTALTHLSISVGAIETSLSILNGTSAVIDPDTNFTLMVQYLNSTGGALAGADVEIDVVPAIGLYHSPSWNYLGNGIYSIMLDPEAHGTFSLTISASLANHTEQFKTFTLTVTPLASLLTIDSSNGLVAADRNYTVYLFFSDESLYGLESATVTVFSVSPSSGISYTVATDLGGGNYSITLIPLNMGRYDILFRATLPKYQNGTVAFTLDVTEVPTNLETSDGSTSASIYYQDTIQIQLLYTRTDSNQNITSATIDVSQVIGLNYSVSENMGVYTLTLTSDVLGGWLLQITASKPSYSNYTILLWFEVSEKPATVMGPGPSDIQYYQTPHSFTLWLNESDMAGLEGANVSITVEPFPISYVDIGNGYYNFSFVAGDPGVYSISLMFSKYGYGIVECIFSFEVRTIDTELCCVGMPAVFYVSREYHIALFFSSTMYGGVEDADFTHSAEIHSFITEEGVGGGWYNFSLTPLEGEYEATFYLERPGYERQVYSFHMGVRTIPIAVSPGFALNETYMPPEFSRLDIALRFIANDTGETISDASVTYSIINYMTSEVFSSGEIEAADGLYQAFVDMPPMGLYYLNITVEREHYETLWVAAILDVRVDMDAQVMRYLFIGFSYLGPLVGLIGATYLGRRAYKKRAFQKHLKLTEFEGRFDDARNVIGLIVLHRNSGLPVYSKMMKEGFEQSLVGGFITAITNFRAEFQEERFWTATPISEIITAVQTKTLICALLTTNTPSPAQIHNLESLARMFGSLFDEEEETILRVSQNRKAAEVFALTFEQLFLEFMDGKLLTRYTSLDSEKMERQYRPLKKAI